MNPFLLLCGLLILVFSTQAAESGQDSEILATRGKGVITQGVFTARAEKIPAADRLGTLRDPKRLQDVINNLLLNSQLAAEAREAGFASEPLVQARMQLAAESELAKAWIQHYKEMQPAADYEQLAREYYQLNKKKILSSPMVDVSHILISSKDRSQQEALQLAASLREQLTENPAVFDALVMQYSEDPSAASNKGKFTNVKPGTMVKPFEDAAFALGDGEISPPVETIHGYHIIRLDAHSPPQQLSFEKVKQKLMDREEKKHNERYLIDYLGTLTAIDLKLSEEALLLLVERLFGEDYVDPYTAGVE